GIRSNVRSCPRRRLVVDSEADVRARRSEDCSKCRPRPALLQTSEQGDVNTYECLVLSEIAEDLTIGHKRERMLSGSSRQGRQSFDATINYVDRRAPFIESLSEPRPARDDRGRTHDTPPTGKLFAHHRKYELRNSF